MKLKRILFALLCMFLFAPAVLFMIAATLPELCLWLFDYALTGVKKPLLKTVKEGIQQEVVCVGISAPFEFYPQYKTEGAACMDVLAFINETVIVPPMSSTDIDTGLVVEIPEGYKINFRGRSGLAFSYKILGFDGVVDSDYRGKLKVILFNLSKQPFKLERGDRIAQIELERVIKVNWVPKHPDKMTKTARGKGGFGSTGIK